jgi:AcrR family transcriptional regulator
MAGDVKPRRRYDSPRRREQAAATRRDILDAALRLFERQGYAATSMAAIAAEAGVALKTVYLAFETKRGVLIGLWHLLLRGDEEPVPVGERPWFREVLDEPDPARQLRINARNSRRVKERAVPLLQILRDAAAVDAEIDALWRRIQAEFHDNQRSIVEVIHANGALEPSLDVARATDILWTINHPIVYALLVRDRGWTPEQYEEWLATTSCRELLAAPSV